MRQLSPPLRHPSDSEVGSLFSHLLLLRLPLLATGTRVQRSRMVTDGWGAVGGESNSDDDDRKLLLLFDKKTSALVRGACTRQSTSGHQMRKTPLGCSWSSSGSQRANPHLTLSPSATIFTRKHLQRIIPSLVEGNWPGFFLDGTQSKTNKKKEIPDINR